MTALLGLTGVLSGKFMGNKSLILRAAVCDVLLMDVMKMVMMMLLIMMILL